jgi:hypothetical protein
MGKGWMSVLVQRRKLVNNVFSYDDYRGADRAQFESLQKSLSQVSRFIYQFTRCPINRGKMTPLVERIQLRF